MAGTIHRDEPHTHGDQWDEQASRRQLRTIRTALAALHRTSTPTGRNRIR